MTEYNFDITFDSENPNPVALEITKIIINKNSINFGNDTQKATYAFMSTYLKVLYNIKNIESNPKTLQDFINTTFSD